MYAASSVRPTDRLFLLTLFCQNLLFSTLQRIIFSDFLLYVFSLWLFLSSIKLFWLLFNKKKKIAT